MLKIYIVITFFALIWLPVAAQRVVIDINHLKIVNENGAVRLAGENTNNNYLSTINQRLSDINVNVGSVVLVQTLIHSSLTQVNQALKSGIAIRQIGELGSEIIAECNKMVEIARSEPYLLLFAEDVASQLKSRGVNLVSEVSAFVLKEGSNVLMDFEKRDQLLRKIILELKVMRALCYSMGRSMYWAKVNGVLKTANPYQNFISLDRQKADEIIRGYQILKQ